MIEVALLSMIISIYVEMKLRYRYTLEILTGELLWQLVVVVVVVVVFFVCVCCLVIS